jgi:glutamine synthetase
MKTTVLMKRSMGKRRTRHLLSSRGILETMDEHELKHFLELTYDELEEKNLKLVEMRRTLTPKKMEEEARALLTKTKAIKAVTVCFSNIEGRLHTLDYDKQFFLKSADNLTFDGSSVRGFSELGESDLRLCPDWGSLKLVPADVFGPGKVMLFAEVQDLEHNVYPTDFRGQLRVYMEELGKKGMTAQAAAETEGFLVAGKDAEHAYSQETGFELISTGGYYHALPLDELRQFIDRAAEAERAMGFCNEKDHPEVAPSQFELNWSYCPALETADNIQLYKLVSRQIANNLGFTASFLPKPVAGINGNGMHLNISIAKNGKNAFYDKKGNEGLSPLAWDFISRVLNHAQEICLVLNSSVNSYRRLDPNFEAPNQIKVSSRDRGSMVRIPVGNEKTARIEVRSVAPDANPYLALLTLFKTGLTGEKLEKDESKRDRVRFLPGTIYDAIRVYKSSEFVGDLLGEDAKGKYLSFKEDVAGRSPRELGNVVKTSEVIYHHEVTNQVLWNRF